MLGLYCKSTYSRGVSLVEVVLALALFSAIAGFVFGGQWSITDQLLHTVRNISALHAGQQSLISILQNNDSGSILEFQNSSQVGLFDTLHTISVLPFSRCEKVLQHSTSWRTGWGSFATTSLSFISTDLLRVAALGKDCGGQSKNFLDSLFHETGVSDGGSPVAAVDSFKNHVFLGLRPVVGQPLSTPDLAVVSIDDPSAITRFDIPMGETNGVNKIDVVDGFLFTANNSSTTQLAILRAETDANSRDLNLELVATSTLPGVSGVRPEAVSIFYADSKIYIGTKRTAGHEFHIFDVSNPQWPEWLGSREMNHNINDIVVSDGYAFLATSGNVRDLIVLDVRDPQRVSEALTVDLPGTEDGRSVQISANVVFLGRYKGTQPGRNELCVLRYWRDSDSSPLQMSVIDSIATGADVVGISVAAGRIFAATSHPQKELQIFEFDSDQYRLVPSFNRNLPTAATGLDIEGGVASVGSGSTLMLFGQE